jgi:site-specific DNA recombinase
MNKTEKLAAVKEVAIYLRISDEKKVNGKRMTAEETLENHQTKLVSHCIQKGYKYKIFKEIVSGGKTDIGERPQLNAILKQLSNFDAILVIEISRISRDTFISALVKQKMISFDKLILTPEASYYLKDQTDGLLYDVNSMISAHERETIGKRIKFNKLEMARRGLNASGSVPIGYIRNSETKKLEIDLKTAHIPATAFYLNSIGYGSKKIQEVMNDLGFRTANNKLWTNTTIKDLLKKETYKGFTVYHDYETKTLMDADGNEIKKREIKDTIHVEGTHPAIIDPIKFNQLAMKRQERGVKYGQSFKNGKFRERATKTPPSILKDLLFCSACDRKKRISYDKNRGEYSIRSCTDISADGTKCLCNGMKEDKLKKKILADVYEYKLKLEKEIIELLNNDTENLNSDYKEQQIRLEQQLCDLGNEAKKLSKVNIALRMEDDIDEETLREIKEQIRDNKDAQENIKIQLKQIDNKLNAPKVEVEVQKRTNIVDIINKIEKEKDAEKINNFLKCFIFKIHYSRFIPEEIKLLGAKSPEREKVEPEIEIEFI